MNLICFLTSRRQSIYFFSVLLFCATGFETVSAQGGLAGSFLRVGFGARAKAMGGAYSALARGVEASYYNPAGLAFKEKRQVLTSYRFLSLDRQFTFIGFSSNIRPKISADGSESLNGGLALVLLYTGVSDIDGRNSDGQHFADLSNSEFAFMFAFAIKPTKRLSVGLAIKVLWNRFPNVGINGETISASSVGLDLGLLYKFNDWLSLAATIKEINAKYRWNSQDLYDQDGSESIDPLPKVARYGIAFKLPRYRNITLAIDFEQLFRENIFSNRIDQRLHIGANGRFMKNILLRAGYDDGAFTAGAGYRFPVFGKLGEINYAFAAAGNRPEEEHIFTWLFYF